MLKWNELSMINKINYARNVTPNFVTVITKCRDVSFAQFTHNYLLWILLRAEIYAIYHIY